MDEELRELLEAWREVDDRSIPDIARRLAEAETESVAIPDSKGAYRACVEAAIAVGIMAGQRRAGVRRWWEVSRG